jgi:hypothetical protein
MDFPIDAIPIPDHSPKKIPKTPLDNQGSFREGLRFRKVHPVRPVYSARVGANYRAVGIRQDNDILWFWIGSHADYDRLLRQI